MMDWMRAGRRRRVVAATLATGLLGGSSLTIASASPGPSATRICDADRPAALIGRSFSEELADEAVRESGAMGYRLMGPGIPSSADYLRTV